MTCPHLKDGRCALAELLAARELGVRLECPTTEETCARCQKRGLATEDNPQLPALGNATKVVPRERLPEWSAFCSWATEGKSRGLGDTVAKITRATGIDKVAKVAAKVVGRSGGCGCAERQRALNKVAPYSPPVEPRLNNIQP